MAKAVAPFLLLLAAMAAGQAAPTDPAGPSAAPKTVRFPAIDEPAPKPAPPPPKADPAAPARLAPGQFYVVASTKPLLVLTSGPGAVSVQERKPPFMLPAAQAVGWTPDAKDPDFVTWGVEYPHLYVLRAAKTGDLNLTVIPAVTDVDPATKLQIPLTTKDVITKALVIDDGTTPKPKIDPIPEPTPKPKVDPLPTPVTGLRVLLLYEKEAKLSREQLNITSSSRIAGYLNDKCAKGEDGRPEWRKWDMSTVDRPGGLDKESAVLRALFTNARPKLGRLPQVVIAVNQDAYPLEWEATEEAMLALLRKYGG